MIAGISLGSQLSKFSHKPLAKLLLALIIIMPIMCSGLYIWSLWNPTKKTSHLNVAVINEDEPVNTPQGEVKAGNEVIKQLISHKRLNWIEVNNPAQAIDDLEQGKYALVVRIPKSLSYTMTHNLDVNEHKSKISVTYNDANNFVQSQVGSKVMSEVMGVITRQYSEKAAQKVALHLDQAGEDIQSALTSAQDMQRRAANLHQRSQGMIADANSMANNLVTARNNYGPISEDVSQATVAGMGMVSAVDLVAVIGANLHPDFSLLNPIAKELGHAIDSIVDPVFLLGVTKVGATVGLTVIADQLSHFKDPKARAYGQQLFTIKNTIDHMAMTEKSQRYLREQTHKAILRTFDLENPRGPVQQGIKQLRALSERLHHALVNVRNHLNELNNAAADLKTQMAQDTDEAFRLSAQVSQIAAATGGMDKSAQKVVNSLRQEAKKFPRLNPEEQSNLASNISHPVDSESKNLHPLHDNVGKGLSPYFLILGLFLGALCVWMIVPALLQRAIVANVSSVRAALISAAPIFPLVLLQVLGLFLFVVLGLKVTFSHVLEILAFLVLASITFTLLIQAIIAVCGNIVGRLIAVSFFIVQLVFCGGLMPASLQNPLFAAIRVFMPMTYAVEGLQQLINGSLSDHRLWSSVIILILIAGVSLAVTAMKANQKRVFSESDLLDKELLVL